MRHNSKTKSDADREPNTAVLSSVMGALSVLLGCDMIKHLPVATLLLLRACERCGLFFLIVCIAPLLKDVCLFSCFFVSPEGAKSPEICFQKMPPYYRGIFPGASFVVLFHVQNRTAAEDVYSHYYGSARAFCPQATQTEISAICRVVAPLCHISL